ncbi:hypothetical protein CBR_g20974 [Chara braunii]|uniref:Reverse transcriptase domain-containing protein n=1 Tax=Chara braunii TaxID=69332 RepID=A0A388L0J4_CHABU|nr:hypothetical protein CBR_g20974 [Chara braunii]|eukprot:GBG75723.1 hypothetical protein CBR_g20974 [Chara braunii]
MGICNALATFQRAINMTFQNFVNKTRLTQGMINFCVIVYMDDILVYLETYHGHAQHIEWTLGALRDAGFKIALEKSEFFLSEISFLGYVVTRGGLQPDSRKVAAVREAPVPTSLTQVRAFLGLASYYRCFIKGFAAIARPLTNLLRKDQPLSWDVECQQAFATLKDALATAPILIRPDPSKQFILITDWQPEAISAILAQKGNDGREHVIEYARYRASGGMTRRLKANAMQYVIRHAQRPYLCSDLLWFAAFFSTAAIYAATEFRFTEEATARVLAKISAFRRLFPPGISHIAVIVVFTEDITTIPPAIDSDIYRTLRAWAGEVRAAWTDLLARRGDTIVPAHDTDFQLRSSRGSPAISARAPTLSYRIKENSSSLLSEEKWGAWWEDYIELAFGLLEIEFRWSEVAPFGKGPEHPEDSMELLIIQAWRTAEQGDLLGIVFGKVEEGNLTLITDDLLVFLTQLVDDLPLDILSRSDEQPGTHVLSRTLEPHLAWSTCTKIDEDNCLYPSQALYLEIDVTDLTFWDPIARRNAAQDEEIEGAEEEEEEEEPSGKERDDPDYVPERETRIASGSGQPSKKNEEEEEQRKRKRQETAEGKRPTTNVSPVDPSIEDPWRDSEPPEEKGRWNRSRGIAETKKKK